MTSETGFDPKLFDRRRNKAGGFRLDTQIGLDRDGPAALAGDLRHHLVGIVLRCEVMYRDAPALGGEVQRDGPADALPRTRDQHGFFSNLNHGVNLPASPG